MDNVSVLHLSDLHAGPGTFLDIDGKTPLHGATTSSPLERLSSYLAALPRTPDFAVVSGDITIRGDRRGLEEAKNWLLDQISRGLLPPTERVLIVPGNHDVTRRSRVSESERKQFQAFWEVFGRAFPHATIPQLDPDLSSSPSVAAGASILGGIQVETVAGDVRVTRSLPYILDLDHEVLIYGFNSAHGCGLPIKPDPAIDEKLSALINVSDPHTVKTLSEVRDRYLDSLVVDAGMLTDRQIAQFNQHMKNIRRAIGDQFDRLTKIAVLHHHIGHLWLQQLEVKVFETIVDAAQFKQALTENAFDIVLHGHKHTNHVGIDGSLIPVDRTERFNPLCVVSGGTVGGYPRTNDYQSFKIVELSGKVGSRRSAIVREVPLQAANVPGEVIIRDSRVYNLPLADRLPSLHELSALKDVLDRELVYRLAPELSTDAGIHASGAEIHTSSAEFFASTYCYRSYAYTDGDKCRTFYEVVQATKALKFGTIARLHWLVSAAARIGSESRPTKVVVLLGSLEGTHYSAFRSRTLAQHNPRHEHSAVHGRMVVSALFALIASWFSERLHRRTPSPLMEFKGNRSGENVTHGEVGLPTGFERATGALFQQSARILRATCPRVRVRPIAPAAMSWTGPNFEPCAPTARSICTTTP